MRAAFTPIGSASTITQIVAQQLSRYNYTFPTPSNVSTFSFFFRNLWLILVQSDPFRAAPNRSKPYRNLYIITAIRELFFTGGFSSFAQRHHSRFPTFQGSNGGMAREVPVPMVALVATAVSVVFLLSSLCTNMKYQLYAAIREWRTGRHQPAEFSANTYLDVYNGHVQTFRYISENQNGRFHLMMSDIYARAM